MSMWQGVVDWFEHNHGPPASTEAWLGWDAWVETAYNVKQGKAVSQVLSTNRIAGKAGRGSLVKRRVWRRQMTASVYEPPELLIA